jgi:hypothetical protein
MYRALAKYGLERNGHHECRQCTNSVTMLAELQACGTRLTSNLPRHVALNRVIPPPPSADVAPSTFVLTGDAVQTTRSELRNAATVRFGAAASVSRSGRTRSCSRK